MEIKVGYRLPPSEEDFFKLYSWPMRYDFTSKSPQVFTRKMAKQISEKYGTILEISCTASVQPMDADLLCSALLNLIENSAKASAPGQTIRLRAEENMLEVSDHGRGIPQKDLDRITEPFYMGDPSRSKVNGGFGLGLALVKEIAGVHKAVLDIQSTPGEGTTVRLVFPEDGNQTVITR